MAVKKKPKRVWLAHRRPFDSPTMVGKRLYPSQADKCWRCGAKAPYPRIVQAEPGKFVPMHDQCVTLSKMEAGNAVQA